MKKRALLLKAISLVAVLVILVTACAQPTEAPVEVEATVVTEAPAAPAETEAPAMGSGEVVIYGWSGQWDIWFEEWGEKFKEETGITVKYLSGDGDVMFNRVQAEKDDPKADLYLSDTGEGFMFESMGLLDTVDWEKVPNSQKIKPAFLHDSFLTWSTDLAVIGYNKDVNPTPPSKWIDLASPEYKGKITINTPTSLRPAYIWMLLEETYGEDKAWEYLEGMFANAYKWTNSPGEIEQGLATGESLAAVATAGMVMQANGELQAPVFSIIPEEDAIYDDNTILLIKNAPNMENAHKFMDFMLSEWYQDQIMNEHGISVAVNPDVEVTNTEFQEVGLGGNSTEYISEHTYSVDWDYWMQPAEEGEGTRLDALIRQIDETMKGIQP